MTMHTSGTPDLGSREPRASRKSRKIVITAAAVVALLAGGTAAGAAVAGPIDSSGTIHGCYYPATGGSHKVVLQDTGTNCPSGTTAIKWNQTGPAGPAGPQGPPGPSGASQA